jgi:DNA-binding transcriptional LysR family regulator
LNLTEQGEDVFRTARDVLMKLESVRSRLTESSEKPTGTLRITTTTGLGSTWLTQRIHEFVDLYPSVSIRLILDDDELDLSMRQADVAIRLRQPTQPDLIQRRLFTMHMHLFAAPSYLKRFGTPKTVADLDHGHRIVTFGEPVPSYLRDLNWLELAGRGSDNAREAVLKINNIFAIKHAVINGTGIAVLPSYMVDSSDGLVQLLPEEQVPSFATYFVYPAELKNSARVHVFRDFLLSKAQNWSY